MKNFTKKNCWHWMVFPFKAYIIAVPITALLCQVFVSSVLLNKPDAHNASYWDLRLQARVIESENAKMLRLVELGYAMCLAVLLLDAMLAAIARNKNEFRSALIFAVLAIVSMIVFYPASLLAPTM
jgi:hypothetical protein